MGKTHALPPDRSQVRTEQRHPDSAQLDALNPADLVELFCADHRAVPAVVAAAGPGLTMLIDAIVERMKVGGRLIYVGAGTSGRLGVLDAAECPPTFQSDPGQVIGVIAGGESSLRQSSEGKEDDPLGARAALDALKVARIDSVVGIAAGGTTPYVLGATELAKRVGALTSLITCSPPRDQISPCDHLIVLDTGPELLTGSTRLKAGSATKLALNIISSAVFIRMGKVYSNLMVDVRATNQKLRDRALRILVELCRELSREQAAEVLARAEGHLKTAIVMQRLDLDQRAAAKLLRQHGGKLRDVLGETLAYRGVAAGGVQSRR